MASAIFVDQQTHCIWLIRSLFTQLKRISTTILSIFSNPPASLYLTPSARRQFADACLPRSLDVLGARFFVLGAEESAGVTCEEGAEFADLLAEAVDCLGVHVRLGDHFRHVDFKAG